MAFVPAERILARKSAYDFPANVSVFVRGTSIKKLKKKYYVRIHTYVKVGQRTYYSAWSKTKKVKTK